MTDETSTRAQSANRHHWLAICGHCCRYHRHRGDGRDLRRQRHDDRKCPGVTRSGANRLRTDLWHLLRGPWLRACSRGREAALGYVKLVSDAARTVRRPEQL